MKEIYNKYCNDIQNPALGAYLISTFVNFYYKHKGKNATLIDIIIFIPLMIVKDTRELIFWKSLDGKWRKITKMSKFYEKVGYIGKAHSNFTIGTINGIILKFREYVMASLIFGIESNILRLKSNGEIVSKELSKFDYDNNLDIYEMTTATSIIADIYAKDTSLDEIIKNLEVYL